MQFGPGDGSRSRQDYVRAGDGAESRNELVHLNYWFEPGPDSSQRKLSPYAPCPYEALPAGRMLNVYNAHGAPGAAQMLPSELLLKTVGSETAFQRLNGAALPARRLQHCVHFQGRRMCTLGSDCHFVHSKVPPLPLPGVVATQAAATWAADHGIPEQPTPVPMPLPMPMPHYYAAPYVPMPYVAALPPAAPYGYVLCPDPNASAVGGPDAPYGYVLVADPNAPPPETAKTLSKKDVADLREAADGEVQSELLANATLREKNRGSRVPLIEEASQITIMSAPTSPSAAPPSIAPPSFEPPSTATVTAHLSVVEELHLRAQRAAEQARQAAAAADEASAKAAVLRESTSVATSESPTPPGRLPPPTPIG